jgi:ribosomal protein S1
VESAAEAVEPETVPAPEAAAEPEPEAVIEPVASAPAAEAEPEPELMESDPAPEPVAVAEAEPKSAPEAVAEPEPEPEPESEAGSGLDPEPDRGPAQPAEADRPDPGSPPAGPKPAPPATRPAAAGKLVEGVVTSVSADEVELTLDDGRAAVINRRNFAPGNQDPREVLSPGDRAFGAELSREDPKQRVVLSRSWALKRMAWDKVMQAAGLNESVTGKVVSVGAKGVVVDVGVRGFVPTSHLDLEPVSDLSSFLDQVIELKVLEADPQRERLVLSRRSLLLREQRKKAQEILSSLKPGDVRRGKVTSITNYGAFVDIGGVNGLVHLSELSWRRIRRPNDVVTLGDEVEVQVLDVKPKKRRIGLSIRRLTPDPLEQLNVGDVMTGPVTRLVDFGAFVALGELEGLVHLSELAEYRVSTPEQVVAPGEVVGVKVLSIDTKRRRIELSIRQAAEFGG